MTKPGPIRAAVIGAGVTANLIHLPILARLHRRGELTLALICDLDEKRRILARRKYGFLSDCTDAAVAATREDLDAVYVLGSAQLHYEYGLMALQQGKHLFVEKPIAPSFVQAQILAAAACAGGLVAVGGHNRRFYKSLDAARMRGDKAGWHFAEAVAHKPEFGKRPPFGARTWLTANGIHALDALVFVMGGLPARVTAHAGDPPGTFSAIMRWADGAQAIFLCDNNAGARREEYAFHAPGETCRIGSQGAFIEKDGRVFRTGRVTLNDGFEAEHESFLDAIRQKSEPRHAIAALMPSLFLAERIEDGFDGALALPHPLPQPVQRRRSGSTVLVLGGAGLQAPLARCLSGHRLIDLAAVRDAPGPCADVRAAVLGPGSPPLPDEILDKLPNLGALGIAGLSLSQYRPDALLRRGILLFNASATYAETVADFAFALAVLGRRRAFVSYAVMRQGGWGTTPGAKGLLRGIAHGLRPAFRATGLEAAGLNAWHKWAPSGTGGIPRDLRGATVGLIGWSANARAFAERLSRSGAIVQVWSERAAADEMPGVSPKPLGEVLAADIVSLHRGLTPATRHFLGAAELARLRPGAVLINVARGALIEPKALLERLGQGDVFACLDTYDEEPLDNNHPLRGLPNVFLTSHIAGGSPDMREAAGAEVVEKVAAWLGGKEIPSVPAGRIFTMT